MLETLEKKKGYHTELVSLYIPPHKQLSDIINYLYQEYGTASNIKSKTTRKNVMDSIMRTIQRLKTFKSVPPTGLIIFCGAIPQNGQGTERIEQYVIVPPEPITLYKYLCSSEFYLEPLKEMLVEKDAYGLIVIDRSDATFAVLRGRKLDIIKNITSGVPGKHDAGGQSARRFERIIEQVAHEFYVRAGEYANKIFLEIPDLKGIIIGGPGATKEKFAEGSYLDYRLKEKILATLDTGYTQEMGVKELIDRADSILKNVRFAEEKKLVQTFLGHLAKDTGLAIYGEKEVRKALNQGAVDILLLSEGLEIIRAKIKCPQCGYEEEKTLKGVDLTKLEDEVASQTCPKCNSSQITILQVHDIVEELGELAEASGAKVEVISKDTEEGAQLLNFGGIAAILRYKIS